MWLSNVYDFEIESFYKGHSEFLARYGPFFQSAPPVTLGSYETPASARPPQLRLRPLTPSLAGRISITPTRTKVHSSRCLPLPFLQSEGYSWGFRVRACTLFGVKHVDATRGRQKAPLGVGGGFEAVQGRHSFGAFTPPLSL